MAAVATGVDAAVVVAGAIDSRIAVALNARWFFSLVSWQPKATACARNTVASGLPLNDAGFPEICDTKKALSVAATS